MIMFFILKLYRFLIDQMNYSIWSILAVIWSHLNFKSVLDCLNFAQKD